MINNLKNYNKIWDKIERLMMIEFHGKPTYGNDDKYIKTKIKTYKYSITRNFYNKKGPKNYQKNTMQMQMNHAMSKIPCKCLSILILDSVLYA